MISALTVQLSYLSLLPFAYREITNNILVNKDFHYLKVILIAITIGFILKISAGTAQDYVSAKLGANSIDTLRLKMFQKLQMLDLDYYRQHNVAELVNHFVLAASTLERTIAILLPNTIKQFLLGCISLLFLILIEWRLSLVILIILPLTIITPRFFAPRAAMMSHHKKLLENELAQNIQENVVLYPIIRLFNLQKYRSQLFSKILDRATYYGVQANLFSQLISRTTIFSFDLLTLVVVGLGSIMVFNTYLTVGSLIGFIAFFLMFVSSIEGLVDNVPSLIEASEGMENIEALLSEKVKTPSQKLKHIDKLQESISFNNVSFNYRKDKPIVEHLNLSIKKGEHLALIGRSGSGKSTIISLLLKLYSPTQGKITYDNIDLENISEDSLHHLTSVVVENNYLFDTTITENIRMGKLDATKAEIIEIAKQVGLDPQINNFAESYDTKVGELGTRLSQGQRQRIAIARALLHKPSLLILDDATMALDPQTETQITDTLSKLGTHCTIISATHRLVTAMHMDHIVVLEDGQIIEQGNHSFLLQANGLYTKLWEKQTGVIISPDGLHAELRPSLLRAIPLLDSLDEDTLLKIADLFITERATANTTVVTENTPADKFYIIARGRVAVMKSKPPGEPERIATLDDGDFFGEIALIEEIPRTASVLTTTPCLFLTLNRQHFNRLLDSNPDIAKQFREVARTRRQQLQDFN